jgi:hypothetical protein
MGRKVVYGIRKANYRGQDGYIVFSRGAPWNTSIFTPCQSCARRMLEKVRRGEQVNLADFQDQDLGSP